MEKYSYQYVGEAAVDFVRSIQNTADRVHQEARPGADFNRFSLRDAVRLVGMIQSQPNSEETVELEDRIARQVFTRVPVTFWEDDVQVGAMATITDASQSLETDPFLMEHPSFYQLLLGVATGYILKNFTAPLKNTLPATAPEQGNK